SYYNRFGAFYARSFAARPWATLAVTNGTLSVVADSLAQSLERYQSRPTLDNATSTGTADTREAWKWDWSRTGRFAFFGVGMAPLLAEWNKFIEYRFPLRTVGAAPAAGAAAAGGKVSLVALGKRVAFDQILFAPFGLVCFVGTMGLLEYRNWQGVKGKFEDMYLSALFANWQLWPMIQLVNFRFVPLRLRVPFTSACGIAWTLWLSLLS
ncbi:hypothetical protein BCV69DRAFT_235743, partial [Microstroma glucosiphilum]